MRFKHFLAIASAFSLSGVLAAGIPYFWLDRPHGRDNPHDPGSPLYVTPTAVAPAGTRTDTPTRTATRTYSITMTYTPSATPPGSLTDSPTPPPSATVTPTFTVTPAATHTRTPSATYTPCAASTPSLLVEDFESGSDPAGNYVGGPSSLTVASGTPGDCSVHSLYMQASTSGWGGFYGFSALSTLDVHNATALVFDIKTDKDVDLFLVMGDGAGYSNRKYQTRVQLTASAGWQHIVVPVSAIQNMLSPAACSYGSCNPWVPGAGDVVSGFEFDLNTIPATVNANIYFDNIGFITTTLAVPTPTPSATAVVGGCTPTPTLPLLSFEGAQYGSSFPGDYGWTGLTYGSGSGLSISSPMFGAGYCSSQGYGLDIAAGGITAATGIDIGLAGTQNLNGVTVFSMMILAPSGFTGTVVFTDGAYPSTTFKVKHGFTVPASASWQNLTLPASAFTMDIPTVGNWTPSAPDQTSNFEIEADPGTNGPQQVLIDDIGFLNTAVVLPTATPTPTPGAVCIPVPGNPFLSFEGAQYGSSFPGDYGWYGLTYGSGSGMTLPGSPLVAGQCSAHGFALDIDSGGITAATGVDIGLAGTKDMSAVSVFKMAILAPAGFTGTVVFTDGAYPSTTFKVKHGFTVPANASWQSLTLPASAFTMDIPTVGPWTPSPGHQTSNFEIEADPGTTGAQEVVIDDIGFD